MVRPAATVILILVVQRHRNPTNDRIDAASPLFSSPPRRRSPSHPLCPLDRPWHHLGPACGVALRYDAVSAAPARAPLFEKQDNCTSAAVTAAAMPQSPLRRLALDLRFSGRRHQSGDGDGSTLAPPAPRRRRPPSPESPSSSQQIFILLSPRLDGGGHRPWSGGRVMAVCCGFFLGVWWCARA